MFGKRNVAALVAEFLGTAVLTLLILTVQRSTIGLPFFVAAAAGLTIALMIFAIGRVSGGYFNPALVIGFWSARKLAPVKAFLYIVVQLLGGLAAYYLYTYFVKNTFQSIGGDFAVRILVAETVGTAIFAFAVAAGVYQAVSRAVTASFAGLGLMLGIIAASSASLGLLNPAVALGDKAWVLGTYVLGPVIGAIIGVNLYGLLFADTAAVAVEAGQASAVAKPASQKKPAKRPAKSAKRAKK